MEFTRRYRQRITAHTIRLRTKGVVLFFFAHMGRWGGHGAALTAWLNAGAEAVARTLRGIVLEIIVVPFVGAALKRSLLKHGP